MAREVTVAGRGGSLTAARTGAAAVGVTPNKWWVLVTVVFGAFVSILDNTIVNTAIPKLQAVFGADLHQISYVATAYTLAQGVVVPATGFLANRFGIKRVYLASLALFTLGSALCGLSWSTASIIFFRILQGAGGAALFPLSFAILFITFPPRERGRANGFFGIPVLFAPAIGPTVGGYIAQYVDWRWIFYVNVPIGIAGVLLGLRILQESPPRPELRFDMRGFLVAAAGLGLLLYGLSNLAYDGWNSTLTVSGPVLLALVLLAIWVPLQLRTRQPLLDLRLFGRRNYAAGNVITWLGTVGIFGPSFLLPQFLQNLRGLDPYPAGLLLFTQGVGTVIATVSAGNLYNRVGPRVLIVVGTTLIVVTSFWMAGWATLYSPYSVLPWILLVRGMGFPMVLQSANTTALDGVSGRALPGATTLNVVARNVVGSLSIATLANIFQTQTVVHRATLSSRVSRSDPTVIAAYNHLVAYFLNHGMLPTQAAGLALSTMVRQVSRQAAALSFQDVFVLSGIVSIPIALMALLLRPAARVRSQAPGGGPPPAAE